MAPSRIALRVGAAALVAFGAAYARHVVSSRRTTRAAATLAASVARGDPLLRVPHLSGTITLDGDTDDSGWLRPPGPARTGAFVFANGKPARPYSEARIIWGGDYLYLALYAADEDIESHVEGPDGPIIQEDAFRVVFSNDGVEYAIEVSPRAVITDSIRRGDGDWDLSWSSGAHASKEMDGSLNEPKNMDEEWAIELAVPFESLGMRGHAGENIGLAMVRCDTPKRSPRVCGSWGESPTHGVRGRIVLE